MTRPFEIVDVPQGSPEWLSARAGYVTGSRASDIVAKTKAKTASASRANYLAQLVAERLTGKPQEDTFTSPAMERGKALESAARAAYEAHTGYTVLESGFLKSNRLEWVGCSLDGHVAGPIRKIVELKCPMPKTHLAYMKAGKIPADYVAQLQHNLLVTEAESADFVSYCPDLPAHLQLFIVTALPSSIDVDGYRDELVAFLADVDAAVNEWKEYEP